MPRAWRPPIAAKCTLTPGGDLVGLIGADVLIGDGEAEGVLIERARGGVQAELDAVGEIALLV